MVTRERGRYPRRGGNHMGSMQRGRGGI